MPYKEKESFNDNLFRAGTAKVSKQKFAGCDFILAIKARLFFLEIIQNKLLNVEQATIFNLAVPANFVYIYSYTLIIYAIVKIDQSEGSPQNSAKFCGPASNWLVLTIAKPVRPAVGWKAPRAHRLCKIWIAHTIARTDDNTHVTHWQSRRFEWPIKKI